MLAIAPMVVRHCLRSALYDEIGQLPAYTASQTAKLTLELAMHMAAQYATCYDTFCEEKPTQAKVKTAGKPDENLQPVKGKVAPGS